MVIVLLSSYNVVASMAESNVPMATEHCSTCSQTSLAMLLWPTLPITVLPPACVLLGDTWPQSIPSEGQGAAQYAAGKCRSDIADDKLPP